MQQNDLTLLLGEVYYREALLCARNSEWDGCRQRLRGMSSLLPMDHRAAVLHAQVLLREGHLEASLAALQVAKDLGHDSIENDRMVALILGWDEKRYARFKRRIARRRLIRGCKRKSYWFIKNALAGTAGILRTAFTGIQSLLVSKGDQARGHDVQIEEPVSNVASDSAIEQSGSEDLPTESDSVNETGDDPEEDLDTASNQK